MAMTGENDVDRNSQKVIVVAEDDDDLRELISVQLERAGYEVATAADGEDAYAVILDRRPALAIIDIMMPRVYGFEVTRRVRATDEVRETPVILLTASPQEGAAERGLAAGADEYMQKPFESEELLARVHALLS